MDDLLEELVEVYAGGSFDRAIRRTAVPNRAALDTIRLLLVIAKDIRELRDQVLAQEPRREPGGRRP